jgi:hypothetical protein
MGRTPPSVPDVYMKYILGRSAPVISSALYAFSAEGRVNSDKTHRISPQFTSVGSTLRRTKRGRPNPTMLMPTPKGYYWPRRLFPIALVTDRSQETEYPATRSRFECSSFASLSAVMKLAAWHVAPSTLRSRLRHAQKDLRIDRHAQNYSRAAR